MKIAHRLLAVTAVSAVLMGSPTELSAQACGSVAGNVVLNCSFENPVHPNGAVWPNAVVNNWTSSDGLYEVWTNGFSGFGAKDGISHVELNVNSPTTLWQYLSTSASTNYQLSFSAAHRVYGNAFSQIDVYVDNAFLFSTGAMTNGFAWNDFTTNFVATSASTKLEFRGMGNGGSYGNHLDNVSAVAMAGAVSTVPEPSTYALMASGLVALLYASRRRKR